MLTMGSSFLTVNEGWEKYLEDAERIYRSLEEGVKTRLVNLATEARNTMENEKWKDDWTTFCFLICAAEEPGAAVHPE